MYNYLNILTLAPGIDASMIAQRLRGLLDEMPGLEGLLVAPTFEGVFNGGNLIARAVFADKPAWADALASAAGQQLTALLGDRATIPQLESLGYETGHSGGVSGKDGIYRVALFSATINPSEERLERYEGHLRSMPRHVSAIRRWALSRPEQLAGSGTWTHVWEQEYDELGGLLNDYMMHPVHWGHAERWFDTEYPEVLVQPWLVHSYCPFEQGVLR